MENVLRKLIAIFIDSFVYCLSSFVIMASIESIILAIVLCLIATGIYIKFLLHTYHKTIE
jgi:hypothetical protein